MSWRDGLSRLDRKFGFDKGGDLDDEAYLRFLAGTAVRRLDYNRAVFGPLVRALDRIDVLEGQVIALERRVATLEARPTKDAL